MQQKSALVSSYDHQDDDGANHGIFGYETTALVKMGRDQARQSLISQLRPSPSSSHENDTNIVDGIINQIFGTETTIAPSIPERNRLIDKLKSVFKN